jgi:hypothetical protein
MFMPRCRGLSLGDEFALRARWRTDMRRAPHRRALALALSTALVELTARACSRRSGPHASTGFARFADE